MHTRSIDAINRCRQQAGARTTDIMRNAKHTLGRLCRDNDDDVQAVAQLEFRQWEQFALSFFNSSALDNKGY